MEDAWGLDRGVASPMMLAWETLLAQAQANRVTAEAQRDVAQANRDALCHA